MFDPLSLLDAHFTESSVPNLVTLEINTLNPTLHSLQLKFVKSLKGLYPCQKGIIKLRMFNILNPGKCSGS